jgi:ATP-dependent RNA helicase DeaD
MGITEPTDIQKQAIPPVKAGKDLIGMSMTGSGKTAAFGIPVLERIEPGKCIQALIMSPTRELAVQIASEMKKFSKYMKVAYATVYGGVGMQPQIDDMARADIVVGTPGRLLDHLQRGNLDLSRACMVVLDEADKMVDMGFIEDVEKIISQAPNTKQMLLFGATISHEIEQIKERHMKDPEVARAAAHVEGSILEQYYYNVNHNEKFSLLVHLLKKEKTEKSIIFCSTRNTCELVAKNLNNNGIRAEMLHGKLNQNKRQRVMDGFNDGKTDILVASAVAARGLDIKFVTHVFNYDVSQDPQEYIHRVGRTARAGEAGKAITLLSEKDYEAFNNVLRFYDVDVKAMPPENFKKLRFNAAQRMRNPRFGSGSRDRRGSFGGRGGGRNLGGRGSGRSFDGPRNFDKPRRFDRSERPNRSSDSVIPCTDSDSHIKNWRDEI